MGKKREENELREGREAKGKGREGKRK